jgi:hypothetical protein
VRDRTALGTREEQGSGDPGEFLSRNLSSAYRLVTMTMNDPVAAQNVVHDAMLGAWRIGSDRPAHDLDETLQRGLATSCRAALEAADGSPDDQTEPLTAALLRLAADDRFALAAEYGIPDSPGSESRRHGARRWSPDSRARGSSQALKRLRTEMGDPGAADGVQGVSALEGRLRELYASRDPGGDAPLGLRLRLQRSLYEAETAAATRERTAGASGWGFAINAFLVILLLVCVVALLSVIDLRSGSGAGVKPAGGPTTPITITSVAPVRTGIDGPGVHVAATDNSLIASFEGSSEWHPAPQQCLADVTGIIDATGQAQWLGQSAGHVESIAGDAASGRVYASGLGDYCQPGGQTSVDGGSTWSGDPLPTGAAGSPSWLAFDPAQAGTLLAVGDGKLYVSRDAGSTWSTEPLTVTPVGFDTSGNLFGWGPGAIFESTDDGSTWQQVQAGPASQPTTGAVVPGGLLLAEPDGLWWFPLDGPPSLVHGGTVFSIAPAGDGAVVLGGDSAGHPWFGAFSFAGTDLPFRVFALPAALASMQVTGGQVAANSAGAVLAFSGASSAVAFATFAR